MAWAKSPVMSVSAATKRLPKLWPPSPFPRLEAVGEELREQVFFGAESDHAVAQVAGRQHVEVLAQAAGRSAVVGDGDDRGEIGDVARNVCWPVGKGDVTAETAKQRREACAATDGDDAEGGVEGGGIERLRAWLRGARQRWSELR